MVNEIQKKLTALPFVSLEPQGDTAYQRFPVLLLLGHNHHEPSFVLTKRSRFVPQPGDIACPGGAIDPLRDTPVAAAIRKGAFSVYAKGSALEMHDNDLVSLFVAAALREANEEIGLAAANVAIMGILPPYKLRLFHKEIVPLVGQIKGNWQARINREVERIIDIPLSSFLSEQDYVHLEIVHGDMHNFFPALAVSNGKGGEDILWGATFFIILKFLHICFGFETPDCLNKRRVTRHLGESYLSGYGESR